MIDFSGELAAKVFEKIRQLKKIIIISGAIGCAFSIVTTLLFPEHVGQISITATGQKLSGAAQGSVTWLSSPDINELRLLNIKILKSDGWFINRNFFVSTGEQPAELRFSGTLFASQAMEFAATPYGGETEIGISGKKILIDLFSPVHAVRVVRLGDYLSVKPEWQIRLAVIRFCRSFLLLVSLFVFVGLIYGAVPQAQRLAPMPLLNEFGLIFVAVVAFNMFFLISPRAPQILVESGGVYEQNLRGPVHFNVNIDSWDFLDLARNPGNLFTTRFQRYQGRPLYALSGFVLSLPVRPHRDLWKASFYSPLGSYVPELLGYVFLNAVLLSAAVLMFHRLVDSHTFCDVILFLPMVILMVNEVTKAFFWTPHLQIFNIFIPLFALYFYRYMQPRVKNLGAKHFLALGAALGFCSLAYASFAIVMIGFVILSIIQVRTWKALLTPLTFVLPIVFWRMIVLHFLGSFYDAEVVEGRLFTWVGDAAWSLRVFASEVKNNFFQYLWSIAQVSAIPLILLLVLRLIGKMSSVPRPPKMDQELRNAFLAFYASAIPFLYLIGIYRTRLSFLLIPPILILIARELKNLKGRLSAVPSAILMCFSLSFALVYLAFCIFSKGPWS